MAALDPQPERVESKCPDCGGDPLPDDVAHRLDDLGYQHDDQRYICAECGRTWTCGVPIGEFDRPDMADDLRCDSCDNAEMLVHRVVLGQSTVQGDVVLHLKCPNPDCHYFDRIGRDTDDNGRALVGYPQITGATEGSEPYGYVRDDTTDSRE